MQEKIYEFLILQNRNEHICWSKILILKVLLKALRAATLLAPYLIFIVLLLNKLEYNKSKSEK